MEKEDKNTDCLIGLCLKKGEISSAVNVVFLSKDKISKAMIERVFEKCLDFGLACDAIRLANLRQIPGFKTCEVDRLAKAYSQKFNDITEDILELGPSEQVVNEFIDSYLCQSWPNMTMAIKLAEMRGKPGLTSDEVERIVSAFLRIGFIDEAVRAAEMRGKPGLTLDEVENLVNGKIDKACSEKGYFSEAFRVSEIRKKPGLTAEEVDSIIEAHLKNRWIEELVNIFLRRADKKNNVNQGVILEKIIDVYLADKHLFSATLIAKEFQILLQKPALEKIILDCLGQSPNGGWLHETVEWAKKREKPGLTSDEIEFLIKSYLDEECRPQSERTCSYKDGEVMYYAFLSIKMRKKPEFTADEIERLVAVYINRGALLEAVSWAMMRAKPGLTPNEVAKFKK